MLSRRKRPSGHGSSKGKHDRPDIRTLEASTKKIPQDTLSALRGTVALPGEDGYEAARKIWNGMVDRRPGLVVRCLGAADVINAVKLARDKKQLVAVRGGGHNIAGNVVCDGGLPHRPVPDEVGACRSDVRPGVATTPPTCSA
jgi:FAD binding domain